jgi:hypothetical protein
MASLFGIGLICGKKNTAKPTLADWEAGQEARYFGSQHTTVHR